MNPRNLTRPNSTTRFILYTDHESLKNITDTSDSIEETHSSAIFFFQEYNIDIRHIKGQFNVVADWLSRKDIDLHIAILRATGVATSNDTKLLHLNYTRLQFTADPEAIDRLRTEYTTVDTFATIYDILSNNKPWPSKLKHRLQKYAIHDGLLYYSITRRDYPRLCIPDHSHVRA
ncbi:hypothetical protein JCM33374_g4914 [Metschnikowia sp. JCM 33374]|nr:hypothetical protein JCM33374_g4914 [Metschnikowia sp. JCM 33374]